MLAEEQVKKQDRLLLLTGKSVTSLARRFGDSRLSENDLVAERGWQQISKRLFNTSNRMIRSTAARSPVAGSYYKMIYSA